MPYTMKDIDPEKLDVRVMYLNKESVAPLAAQAESGMENAYTEA